MKDNVSDPLEGGSLIRLSSRYLFTLVLFFFLVPSGFEKSLSFNQFLKQGVSPVLLGGLSC